MRTDRGPAARWILRGLVLWVVGFELHATILHRAPTGPLFSGKWPYEAVLVIALCVCAARVAFVREHRRAWMLIGAGTLSWIAGDIYYTAALQGLASPPIPSPADVGYLGFYPLVFAGLALLLRDTTRAAIPSLWLDGVIAALSAAAISAAVVFGAVLANIGGRPLEVATNLAYPLGDMILLGVVVGALALKRWRPDPTWMLLAAALLLFWLTDSGYLVKTAANTYTPGGWLDGGWAAAIVLVARAAWAPRREPTVVEPRVQSLLLTLPLAFATAALGVLVVAGLDHVNPLAIALSAASLVAVMARLALTFSEHGRLLVATREEALTDGLTNLSNRRRLTIDLEARVQAAASGAPFVLALFDLDGFKHYNDSFGHAAGDALLIRLAHALESTLAPAGVAYRIGGDEFCALIACSRAHAPVRLAAAAASLAEAGDGYAIGCSSGAVIVPDEAEDPEQALRVADARMYDEKHERRETSGRGSTEVLLNALAERNAELARHLHGVGDLAAAVARKLGEPPDEIRRIQRAGELHDVGKVAVPDAVLNKPGVLDDNEWAAVRDHTIIGQRIISGDPALRRVADIVRSSHEHYDGRGYPDGLAGSEIPLGSRIVSVCDAFDAITMDRPYSPARAAEAALAELRRAAGTQFDPNVVDAFEQVWAERATHDGIDAWDPGRLLVEAELPPS